MTATAAPTAPPADLRAARRAVGDGRLVDVARSADVSVSLVSMCESGYVPGPRARARIGKALGASAGHFFDVDRAQPS